MRRARSSRDIYPIHLSGVRLRIAGRRWATLPAAVRNLLTDGTKNVATIRSEIAATSAVRSMPPVEIVGEIWINDKGVIHGRATILSFEGAFQPAVQLAAPTAIHANKLTIRAILVHEYAHCFYKATQMIDRVDANSNAPVHLIERHAVYDDHADREMLVDPADWFCKDDVAAFINWGDTRSAKVVDDVSRIRHLPVVAPDLDMRFEGEIGLEDDVVAHIRYLRAKRDAHGSDACRSSAAAQHHD